MTVHVSGMYDATKEVDLASVPSETFTVSGPADELDGLVQDRVQQFSRKLAVRAKQPGAGSNLNKYDPAFGDCGMSWVELKRTGSYVQGQGYLAAGWELAPSYVARATTYDSNVLFFSTSHLDGHVQNVPDYGVMNGLNRRWETRVTIPKKQEYGATMNVGRVDIIRVADGKPGMCYTTGPRVDNVLLYK